MPALWALGCSLALANSVSAQVFGPGTASRSSYVFIGAGNLNTSLSYIPEWTIASQGDPMGAAITTSGGQSFSGNDSQGNPQTMMLTGSAAAKADFGILHASVTGEVDNPYYNADNPAYYDGGDAPNSNGSPQYLSVDAHATFQDTLTLNPISDPVVKIRYIFHVEGNVTDPHAYAVLGFSAGNNSASFFNTDTSTPDWATPDWDVTPGAPIPIQGDFAAAFLVNTNFYNTPEGVNVLATANYYDTLTLTSIQLLDANGDQVNGVSYLTASGTHYNVLGGVYGAASSVPEPGSLSLLAGFGLTGAVCGLKFRRSRA
jgi:hypothetical protein